MHATDVERAITAATALSSELGLVVDEARIVGNSNKLGLRLLPCDVFARVAFSGQEAFQFEIEIARELTEIGSPVASLDTRVEPRIFERDGFAFTLWRHYEPTSSRRTSATASAKPNGSSRAKTKRHGSKTPIASSCSRRYGTASAGSASDSHASNCCMANRIRPTPARSRADSGEQTLRLGDGRGVAPGYRRPISEWSES